MSPSPFRRRNKDPFTTGEFNIQHTPTEQDKPQYALPNRGLLRGMFHLHQNVYPHMEKEAFQPTGNLQTDIFSHAPFAAHAIEQINAATKRFGGGDPEYRQHLVNDLKENAYNRWGKGVMDKIWGPIYEGGRTGLAAPHGEENVMNKSQAYRRLAKANMDIVFALRKK